MFKKGDEVRSLVSHNRGSIGTVVKVVTLRDGSHIIHVRFSDGMTYRYLPTSITAVL